MKDEKQPFLNDASGDERSAEPRAARLDGEVDIFEHGSAENLRQLSLPAALTFFALLPAEVRAEALGVAGLSNGMTTTGEISAGVKKSEDNAPVQVALNYPKWEVGRDDNEIPDKKAVDEFPEAPRVAIQHPRLKFEVSEDKPEGLRRRRRAEKKVNRSRSTGSGVKGKWWG